MKFEDISHRAAAAREGGAEVALVLGLGFVGTAVAANLARTAKREKRSFFVIGLEMDDPRGRKKAEQLDEGRSPTYTNDPSLEKVIGAAARGERRNLVGTTDPRAIGLADVVVSCINLDLKRPPGQTRDLTVPIDGYCEAMRTVGRNMRPGTLVCIESTLPLGMCDRVLYPALCEGQANQGIDVESHPPRLAYCYERVMPGPDYLDSVNNYWRAYAGIDEESTEKAHAFLAKYVNTESFPLWKHKTIRAAEMGKLLENSYRATNIAFIEEWSKLAEEAGVDLFDVIRSIRLRKGTHDNMMWPGLGVGGYCLTKDAMLAAYGAENLLRAEAALPFSRAAILTNERMPLRAVTMAQEHFKGDLKDKRAVLYGVTYRAGVADTRSSPAEIVARALIAEGTAVEAYDPLIPLWEEMPEIRMHADPKAATRGADIAIICLPDPLYKQLLPDILAGSLKPGAVIIDPWNVVADQIGDILAKRGVGLHVFGRGDTPKADLSTCSSAR
jgi:UDP-N-acetyl-D-glucosamine dehydrogenase